METTNIKELFKEVGLNIRNARTAKGWSQKKFANLVGINYNSINRFELGQFVPADAMDKICEVLEMDKKHFGYHIVEAIEHFKKTVKEERTAVEMSKEEVANGLATNVEFVSDIEKGRIVPGDDLLKALSEIFMVDKSYLWDLKEETRKNDIDINKVGTSTESNSAEAEKIVAKNPSETIEASKKRGRKKKVVSDATEMPQITMTAEAQQPIGELNKETKIEDEVITSKMADIYSIVEKKSDINVVEPISAPIITTEDADEKADQIESQVDEQKMIVDKAETEVNDLIEQPAIEKSQQPAPTLAMSSNNGMKKIVLEFPEDYGDIVITIKRDRA